MSFHQPQTSEQSLFPSSIYRVTTWTELVNTISGVILLTLEVETWTVRRSHRRYAAPKLECPGAELHCLSNGHECSGRLAWRGACTQGAGSEPVKAKCPLKEKRVC